MHKKLGNLGFAQVLIGIFKQKLELNPQLSKRKKLLKPLPHSHHIWTNVIKTGFYVNFNFQ